MIKIGKFLLLTFACIMVACDNTQVTSDKSTQESTTSTNKVVSASEIKWEQLNPARGDKSPQAGTIWGDRKGTVPTGFLVKFVDGFSSPPHIHNVTYRGVVISGLIHNDDQNAEKMWMPKGSFWTQPEGESHITAAKGDNSIAYIEIDKGPYLVLPKEEAFDNRERPINMDASNVVWVNQPKMSTSKKAPKVAYLWGNPQGNDLNGNFAKLPSGYTGKMNSQGSIFHAVLIQGQLEYQMPNDANSKILAPGSYFSSEGKSVHQISCKAGEDCIIYIRTNGKFDAT